MANPESVTFIGHVLEYGVILNNYVEQYGLDDYETSVKAIEKITQFTSCEFAPRSNGPMARFQ